ncbi:Dodecaprenyl-phosphate galacturonate synthase [Alphaproteobacteria bacterium SO-S41]|nr:Dodecaprenyl-phosphate galacturonate synthase [Alphaproteobacteria bacterium SO-S41]
MTSESAGPAPELSVVVPVKDEAENVRPLIDEITTALRGVVPFEIVYVDDGSSDGTPAALKTAQAEVPELRVVRHDKNSGQSAGVRTGVKFARAPLVATLDGDGQNDPADIPKLLAAYREAPASHKVRLVGGQRLNRQDTAAKKWASRWANRLRGWLLQDDTRDTGCGLKLFDRAAFLELPYFDHLHRYLPALIKRDGYGIRMVDVSHRARTRGASKYGVLDRALVSIRDLMGVMWLMARRRLPGDVKELER